MNLFAIFLLALVISSCGLVRKETTVSESHVYDYVKLAREAGEPVKVSDTTLIIDARSAFEYQLSHIPGSVSVRPSEFNNKDFPDKVEVDQSDMLRRLSTYGLDKATPVVVVDEGSKGKGEAGKTALMLFYLGVNDIHISDIDVLRKKSTFQNRRRLPSVSNFEPVYKKEIFIEDRERFLQKAESKYIYVGKRALRKKQNEIEISFSEFLNKKGEPNFSLKKLLTQKGINKSHEILVASPSTSHADAATFVLLSLGYKAHAYDGAIYK